MHHGYNNTNAASLYGHYPYASAEYNPGFNTVTQAVPAIINPASLLLRVNKPGDGGEAGKKKRRPMPIEVKDPSYWEKRKKNNESAKRSRDIKRTKEEQLSMRVIYLEQENLQLRTELGMLRNETEQMRLTFYPHLRQQQNQNHSQLQHHLHNGRSMGQQHQQQ
jgi:hypothetical protein